MKVSMLLTSFFLFVFLVLLSLGPTFVSSADHPGKSTVEHPGKAITADSVKKAIEQHVSAQAKSNKGVFVIQDPKLNKDWRLKLAKVHDPVRTFEKDGTTIYFACSDFDSVDSKDVLDIDFWMVSKGNKLEVIDTKIHKVNGEPRFGYEGTNIKEIK